MSGSCSRQETGYPANALSRKPDIRIKVVYYDLKNCIKKMEGEHERFQAGIIRISRKQAHFQKCVASQHLTLIIMEMGGGGKLSHATQKFVKIACFLTIITFRY